MKEKLCLVSETAFMSHYKQENIGKAVTTSATAGVGVGSVVVVTSAGFSWVSATLAPTGVAAFAAHFTTWPLIGGFASAKVAAAASAAAATAASAAVPVAAISAVGVFLYLFFRDKKIKQKILGPSSNDDVARIVGELVFLPLFGEYNDYLKDNKDKIHFAKEHALSRIKDWGYTDDFANSLIEKYLGKKSKQDINVEFCKAINTIKKLKETRRKKKNLEYNNVSTYQIREDVIVDLAKYEVNNLGFVKKQEACETK